MKHLYLIAGLGVEMDTFGRTLTQAEPYRMEKGQVDLTITSSPQRLQESQPHLSLEDCEYLSTGGSFYRQLLTFDGLMLHASAVVVDGWAYLFSAPCGTGKSTHTQLWLQTVEGARILNDDKPALRRENGVWYAYGTPWSGKTDQNLNLKARLGGICVLARGKENTIVPFTGAKAAFALLEQTARPYGGGPREKLLELVGTLLEEVPVWKMHCTPTQEAANMAHRVMTERNCV